MTTFHIQVWRRGRWTTRRNHSYSNAWRAARVADALYEDEVDTLRIVNDAGGLVLPPWLCGAMPDRKALGF